MSIVSYNLLQEVWRKAGQSVVTIPCPDAASAHRLRFSLYNAVKRFKRPGMESEADDALKHGIATCSVTLSPDKLTVIIGQAGVGELESVILAAIGGGEIDKRSPLDRQAEESLERLKNKAQEEVAVTPHIRATPYFTRD